MFSPDLFSDPEVRFFDSSEQNSLLVKALIESRYSRLGRVSETISQSGAQEINSKNFSLQADGGKFLLKKIPRDTSDLEEKRALAREVNRLAGRGLPFPEILPADHSEHELVIEYEASYWCLMEFAEGSYFSGRNSELQLAGNVIIDLFTALANSSECIDCLRTIESPADTDLELLAQVHDNKQGWSEKLGQANADLLEVHWARLENDLNALVRNRSTLMASTGVCHIDLHPHNLLIRHGSVAAILDFESLFVAPLDVMALFGLFKLGRQAVVVEPGGPSGGRIQRMLKSIIKNLVTKGILDSDDPEDIILRAKAEIVRRVLIILRLCLLEGINDWNHVLPVQLGGLKEAEVLFGGI